MQTIERVSTINTAKGLWEDYLAVKTLTPEQKREAVLSEDGDPVKIFDKCVSVSQGHRTHVGRFMNNAVAERYSRLFAHAVTSVERKVRVGNKRDIDVLLEFDRADLFVSVTTIPQERKDETWPNEYRLIDEYRRNHTKGNKPFKFVALFCAQSTKLDLEASIRTRIRKQEMMPQGIIVVCLQDQVHHAQVLSELLGAVL